MEKRRVGLVCARKGSKRLPNKNELLIAGLPLYYRACNVLAEELEWVYLLTDIENPIWHNTVARPGELNGDDVPLQEVARWFLDGTEYEECVLLMATNPFIKASDVREALSLLDNGRMIVRSYDINGHENGLYAFNVDYFLNNSYRYDVHTGAIRAFGTEIHFQHEYFDAKRHLEDNYGESD